MDYLTSTYTMPVYTFMFCLMAAVVFGGIVGILGVCFTLGAKGPTMTTPHPWTPEERARHRTKGTYFPGSDIDQKGGTHGA